MLSDLVVSPYTAELFNHFLLTFQVAACCPRDDRQATYSCCCSTPATTAAMADKLPPILATLSGSSDEGVSLTSTRPYLQPSPLVLIMLISVKKPTAKRTKKCIVNKFSQSSCTPTSPLSFKTKTPSLMQKSPQKLGSSISATFFDSSNTNSNQLKKKCMPSLLEHPTRAWLRP